MSQVHGGVALEPGLERLQWQFPPVWTQPPADARREAAGRVDVPLPPVGVPLDPSHNYPNQHSEHLKCSTHTDSNGKLEGRAEQGDASVSTYNLLIRLGVALCTEGWF